MKLRADFLERENRLVLAVVQCLVGRMSCNIQAVAIDAESEGAVRLYFALRSDDKEDRAEIADLANYVPDAMIEGDLEVALDVWIGEDWLSEEWPGINKRRVFALRLP